MLLLNAGKSFGNHSKTLIKVFYTVFVLFVDAESSKYTHVFIALLNFVIISCSLFSAANEVEQIFTKTDIFPPGYLVTAMSFIFLSVSIRITLIKKFQIILFVIRQIKVLYRVSSCERSYNMLILFAFFACWIFPAELYFNYIKILLAEDGVHTIQMITFFGGHWKNPLATSLALLIRFIAVSQTFALPGYCVVLCSYVCKILTQAIKEAERSIKIKSELEEIFCCLNRFTRKISKCLEQVETALSFMMFLLCLYLITLIFTAITLIFGARMEKYREDTFISGIIMLTMSLLGFYLLSFQASCVQDSGLRLKNTIYSSIAKIPYSICNRNGGGCFLLLSMANELEHKLQITVWGFFTISRCFILEATGAILSYGIIVSQFG